MPIIILSIIGGIWIYKTELFLTKKVLDLVYK